MEIGSDQLKLVAFLSLIADRIQIWFEQRRWKMVACTSSTSAFKLLHTSPVFLHPGSPLLKFNTWHYQCYNWNEVARLFLPGAAFVSVALMVHLILSLPIMFLFLLLPPLLVEKQRLWLQKLFPLFSTNFNPACSLQCSASVFQCFSVFQCVSVLQCFSVLQCLRAAVFPCTDCIRCCSPQCTRASAQSPSLASATSRRASPPPPRASPHWCWCISSTLLHLSPSCICIAQPCFHLFSVKQNWRRAFSWSSSSKWSVLSLSVNDDLHSALQVCCTCKSPLEICSGSDEMCFAVERAAVGEDQRDGKCWCRLQTSL